MHHNGLGNFPDAAPVFIPQVLQDPEVHIGHIVLTQGGRSQGLVQLVDNVGHLEGQIGFYTAVRDGDGSFAHNALGESVLRLPPHETGATSGPSVY